MKASRTPSWPHGARFAFTILDDTDDATVANVKPVYDLLHELGMRTTKTVWPLACHEPSIYLAAETLQDEAYLTFVRELVERGFEIASHGASMESSDRARTLDGFAALSSRLGVTPTLHCNHGQNRENVYWGAERYRSMPLRALLRVAERLRRAPRFEGHVPGSRYFWGDVCRERFRYVRGFAFARLDSAAIPPHRPYRVGNTPWVNYWFSTADAPDATHFKQVVTRERVDEMVERGGACILSTHLGKGFTVNGRVDRDVESLLRYVASKRGWFVPASEILDHQLARSSSHDIAPSVRWRLELEHLADRVRHRLLPRLAQA